MRTLQNILDQRDFSALFQPIMDFSGGTFIGFEGLIRGPAGSPLHSPVNLFGAAKQQGLELETEMLSRQIVLESLPHPSFQNGQTLAYLEKLGIDPEQVIIEITENQPAYDLLMLLPMSRMSSRYAKHFLK